MSHIPAYTRLNVYPPRLIKTICVALIRHTTQMTAHRKGALAVLRELITRRSATSNFSLILRKGGLGPKGPFRPLSYSSGLIVVLWAHISHLNCLGLPAIERPNLTFWQSRYYMYPHKQHLILLCVCIH